jgi:serine/threonine-protein kinase
MFGRRYRIVGLLGRGGMGEVYHADDLELGQAVALKFLPRGLGEDESALTLLRNEVRVARQVSHPNVCRVYDIGEIEGQYFVSMEYVDGEDLASLLRRIGRLSKEKGLDFTRQISAGLAAAHASEALHRDLKPSNIMIDGKGRVRVMDFGLAAFAEEVRGEKATAGTIGYMAPEQLAGRGATTRSDVYALGLVMYEVLTGRRPYEARSIDTLRDAQASGPPPPPSELVSDVDPALDRLTLWCLEYDPAARPGSATAVAAALPGGDPLAAALAAGETPSPELVAAAGGRGGMRAWAGGICLAGILIGLLVVAGLNNSVALFRRDPIGKSPMVLVDRARQILSRVGLTVKPAGAVYGLELDKEFLTHVARTDTTPTRWDQLKDTQNVTHYFWYRESPWALIPYGLSHARVTYHDPPMTGPGMAYVKLDTEGRLLALEVVRPTAHQDSAQVNLAGWPDLFEEADLDIDLFEEVPAEGYEIGDKGARWQGPAISPRVLTDTMRVWIGRSPWGDRDSVRVVAGAYRGRPAYFSTIMSYADRKDTADDTLNVDHGHSADSAAAPTAGSSDGKSGDGGYADGAAEIAAAVIGLVAGVLVLAILLGAPIMAWRHLRQGRGDRRGALRFGTFVFVLLIVRSILAAHHSVGRGTGSIDISYEINMIIVQIGVTLFQSAYIGLAYLALEPYVRKHWPDSLISWTRLVSGRIQDALVGRDVLLGGLTGVLIAIAWQLRTLVPQWFGLPPVSPVGISMDALSGGAKAVAAFLSPGFLLPSMFGVLGLVLLVILLRRRWIAIGVFVAIFAGITVLVVLPGGGSPDVSASATVITVFAIVIVALVLFTRLGLLAVAVASFFFFRIKLFPITLDSSAWYAGTSAITLLLLTAIAVYAFRTAITSRRAPDIDIS